SVTTAACVWLAADALEQGLTTVQGVGLALLAVQAMLACAALWLDVLPVDVWIWRLTQVWCGVQRRPLASARLLRD
ncbi:MAG: DUF3623 family protein, partial [Roseiflexus sp.]